MSNQIQVSVAIITRDTAGILPKCLESAHKLSDDVVIVTNSSHKFVNFADQKNYVVSLCTHNWVLSLDDDEWLSPELITEIKNLPDSSKYSAYKIPRLNYIFGKAIRHTNWSPTDDTHIWLFQKSKSKWIGVVHEEVIVDGEVGKLKNLKIHQNYSSVEQFMSKMNDYTSRETKVVNPVYDFLRRYFWHQGFLDGWHGLFLSYLMMIYHLTVWVKKNSSSSA